MDLYKELGQIEFDPLDEEQRLLDLEKQEEDRIKEAQLIEQERAEAKQDLADQQSIRNVGTKVPLPEERTVGDKILDTPVLGQVASVGAGVIDTGFDVAGLVPWLKPAEEWWDEYHGRDRETNPINKIIRDAAGIIVPTLTGGGIVFKGIQGFARAGKIGTGLKTISGLRRSQVLGRIAVDLGVGTGIEAVSDQTDEAGNVSSALEELTGMTLPLASRDSDDPAVIKAKNIMEGFALGGAVGLLDALFSLKKAVQIIPKDEAAKQIIDEKIAKETEELMQAGGDELVATVESKRLAREAAITDEAERRFNLGSEDYDPYVNEPSFEMDRPVGAYQADPMMAKLDITRIKNGVGSDGSVRPVLTKYYQTELLNADAPGRNVILRDMMQKASPKYEARIKTSRGVETISAKEMATAVDELTEAVTKSSPEEFEKLIKKTLDFTEDRIVVGGRKVQLLTTAGAKQATEILQRGLDIVDPQALRASAMATNQAASEASTMASVVTKMGDINSTSQQELMIDNLALLIREVGVHKSIKGTGLNAVKFLDQAKRAKELDVQWWADQTDAFDFAVANKTREAKDLAFELKKVAKEDPNFYKPFYREMAKTGGEVDSLHALAKVAENRLGFWKKAFVDGSPEMPSNLVRELQSARYNSILSGLAPVRAAAGGAIALVGKPLTVFAGSAAGKVLGNQSSIDAWKRATYVYGGVIENFQRAMKNLQQEWKFALENPQAAANKGRTDIRQNALDDFETLEEMSSQWYKDGHFGKVAVWNMTKGLSYFNNQPWVRWGLNSMYAIDGFTKSFTTSMAARAKAYDDLLGASNGVLDLDDFNKMQRKLYNDVFKADGSFTDEALRSVSDAASFAAGEINLNLDSKIVSSLETMMAKVPILRSIFMFPRTGVNALELAASFSPGNMITTITNGNLNLALGKARRVLTAKTEREILDVMSEHGLAGFDEAAFKQLKSEYIGRQIMGSTVVMGAALMAANGMMTGTGPADDAERRRMQAMGWRPFSLWDPVTNNWRSYQGLEPFDTFLGLTADIVYNFNRVDQAVTEDWFRALGHSITMNVTQKSFLSGFEPLAGLFSGDPSAFNRFLIGQTNSIIPGAGVRSILNNVVTPQLKDVENNYLGWLANRNKWLVGDDLVDHLDVYTGKPINYMDPWTNAVNAFLPFFKTNPGMEPWRQQLLASGWDRLQTVRRNRNDGTKLTPQQRQDINNWIATNYKLGERVEALFNADPQFWEKEMRKYAKARGLKKQEEYPIKETLLHKLLDDLHNDAFAAAFAALSTEDSSLSQRKALESHRDNQIYSGEYENASGASEAIENLRNLPK